jgi:hypothetical protein
MGMLGLVLVILRCRGLGRSASATGHGSGTPGYSQRRRLKTNNMPTTVAMQMTQKMGYVQVD